MIVVTVFCGTHVLPKQYLSEGDKIPLEETMLAMYKFRPENGLSSYLMA